MTDDRSRMQIETGYLNSFDTVIRVLRKSGKEAQALGFIANGACMLHAAVELQAVLSELADKSAFDEPAKEFAKWLETGPKLAKAAGCYVEIKVTQYRKSKET